MVWNVKQFAQFQQALSLQSIEMVHLTWKNVDKIIFFIQIWKSDRIHIYYTLKLLVCMCRENNARLRNKANNLCVNVCSLKMLLQFHLRSHSCSIKWINNFLFKYIVIELYIIIVEQCLNAVGIVWRVRRDSTAFLVANVYQNEEIV